jgi:hypothetical protein
MVIAVRSNKTSFKILEISGPPELVSSCVKEIKKWQSMKTSVEKHLEKQYLDLLSISEARAHVEDFIHQWGAWTPSTCSLCPTMINFSSF